MLRTAALIALFCLTHACQSFGDNDSTETIELNFAHYLFSSGEFYRATTEYLRVLHSIQNESLIPPVIQKISMCYFKGEDYSGCIQFLDSHYIMARNNVEVCSELSYLRALCDYKLNHYAKVIADAKGTGSPRPDNLRLLSGISFARLFDWRNSIQELASASPSSPSNAKIDSLHVSMLAISRLPAKSPVFSGALSAVIPGAGYFYCRRISTAVVSFVINSVLAWSLYDAFSKKQYGIAAACFFFGSGWYTGNIIGSANAARRYNSYMYNSAINKSLTRWGFDEYTVFP
jgi:hypothetical protein